ncbi:MAG: hypothetical protein Q7U97_04270 [Rhodocyclaceae bacterium]|nr:hypothetical protein [Rhodocyclaceae bacterium]
MSLAQLSDPNIGGQITASLANLTIATPLAAAPAVNVGGITLGNPTQSYKLGVPSGTNGSWTDGELQMWSYNDTANWVAPVFSVTPQSAAYYRTIMKVSGDLVVNGSITSLAGNPVQEAGAGAIATNAGIALSALIPGNYQCDIYTSFVTGTVPSAASDKARFSIQQQDASGNWAQIALTDVPIPSMGATEDTRSTHTSFFATGITAAPQVVVCTVQGSATIPVGSAFVLFMKLLV